MSNLSNWEIMIMLILFLFVVAIICVVLCRQQNMYQALCINMCNTVMQKLSLAPVPTSAVPPQHRQLHDGSKLRIDLIQDTSLAPPGAKTIPVMVISPSEERLAANHQATETSSQTLLEPPEDMKRAVSWISLAAIEGEYDTNVTGGISRLKRTYSAISIDANAALVPTSPDPLSENVMAMVEASLCFDANRGYLNIGIAYAYGMKLEDLKAFSECYVRLIVTPMVAPPASPSRSQYRTTKVVKTAEVVEILQKFRFDLPKNETNDAQQRYDLAKLQIEFNAYGRARSHATLARREMILDTNMLPNCEPRVAMLHLYKPNLHDVWEPPNMGEVQVSMCYQANTNKLTLILMQIKNLQLPSVSPTKEGSVRHGDNGSHHRSTRRDASSSRRHHSKHHRTNDKEDLRALGGSAYLMIDGKQVGRKKLKEVTIYDEQVDKIDLHQVVFFQLDADAIQGAELRILIERINEDGHRQLVGFLYIGNSASGNGLLHWKYIMGNTRKPYVLWHPIIKYPVEMPKIVSKQPEPSIVVETVNEVASEKMDRNNLETSAPTTTSIKPLSPISSPKFEHVPLTTIQPAVSPFLGHRPSVAPPRSDFRVSTSFSQIKQFQIQTDGKPMS